MWQRIQQWYKIVVRRHVACWPEEYFKPSSRPSNTPVADVGVLRSSVHRYFKYNQSDLLYVLPYEPMYEQAIETMRLDGWQVQLQCGAGGELFYTISSKIKKNAV